MGRVGGGALAGGKTAHARAPWPWDWARPNNVAWFYVGNNHPYRGCGSLCAEWRRRAASSGCETRCRT
eukprot:scaffold141465_cov26-Tisochrysis_lutea.AAC.3